MSSSEDAKKFLIKKKAAQEMSLVPAEERITD